MLKVASDGAPFLDFRLRCVVKTTECENFGKRNSSIRPEKVNNSPVICTFRLYSFPAMASALRRRCNFHYAIVAVLFSILRLTYITSTGFLVVSSISLFVFAVDNTLICEKKLAQVGMNLMGSWAQGGFYMPRLQQLRRKANMSIAVSILSSMYCAASIAYAIHSDFQPSVNPSPPPGNFSCYEKARHWHHASSPKEGPHPQMNNIEFLVTFMFNIVAATAIANKPEDELCCGNEVNDSAIGREWLMKAWMLFNILLSFGWLAAGLAGIGAVDMSFILSLGSGRIDCWSFPLTLWNVQHFNEFLVIIPAVYFIILEALTDGHLQHYVPDFLMITTKDVYGVSRLQAPRFANRDNQSKCAKFGRKYCVPIFVLICAAKFLLEKYFHRTAHPIFLTCSSFLIFLFSTHNSMVLEKKIKDGVLVRAHGWFHKLTMAKERARRESMHVFLSRLSANFGAANLAFGALSKQRVPGTTQNALDNSSFHVPLYLGFVTTSFPLSMPTIHILFAFPLSMP